jgi:hypothetical protein
MDITNTFTADDLQMLHSYQVSPSHGRGRLVGITARLYKLGLLQLRWTSQVCWVLTLSSKGAELLKGSR